MLPDHFYSANRLLAALPEVEYLRLKPYLISTSVASKIVLYEPLDKIETVYFPNTSLISLVNTLKNGAITEVSLVGSTGMIGLSAILDNGIIKNRAVVRVPGNTMKISAEILKQEFGRGGELQNILLRYTQTRLDEITQLAICNAHHIIEQRLAYWLLKTSDLMQSDNLPLTQEFLSHMLGVRRSGVTLAAQTLQREGIINYHWGKIKILDREALENISCECYKIFRDNFYSE